MKVGDLVRVDYPSDHGRERDLFRGFVSIVLEVNKSENHPNGLGLVKVVEDGQEMWYPLGYIEVINETG
jgi:hypothetical protein